MGLRQFFAINPIFNRNCIIGKIPYVRFMNEADMIRKTVDALPVNGSVSFKSSSDFINLLLGSRAPAADIFVAEEASLYSGHCSSLTFSYIAMTKFALNIILCDVYC